MTSEKDSDNENDVDKTINENNENRLSMEKSKPNIISMVNITKNKVILNKTTTDTVQEKCNEIKIWRKNNTAISKDENKTINEIIHSSNSILKNDVKDITVTKTQEDLPDSTANCTSNISINRIEDI